jgi:hypothetical protein
MIIRGKKIREDSNGMICLDDIWTVAQAKPGRAPKKWRLLPSTKRLEAELKKKVSKSALMSDKAVIPVIYARLGRGNAGTFAHPIMAAAYAGYLSPKLEIEVREVWLRFRAGDATLADEIMQRASATDNEWIAVRALSRAKRVSYTETLRNHGVDVKGYPLCTNAIYRQILGSNASSVKARRGLPQKANLRNHLETDELSFVMAAEVLATDRIAEEDRRGNDDCAHASERSASFIREAIERDRKDRQRRFVK